MAVDSCTLMRGYPRGTQTGDLRASYSVKYIIRGTGLKSVTLVGQQAQGKGPHALPYIGHYFGQSFGQAAYGLDQGSYCQRLTVYPSEDAAERMWYGEAEFSPLPEGKSVQDISPAVSPLDRPAQYWVEYGTETEPVHEAYCETNLPGAGVTKGMKKPIVNAAGRSYDEALFRDRRYVILCESRNVPNVAIALQIEATYGNTLNAGSWGSVPEHCAKFLSCETGMIQTESVQQVGTVTYYEMITKVAVKREPWYQNIVNRGYYSIVYPAGTAAPILIENEDTKELERVTEPQLLDLDGRKLGDGVAGNTIPYRVEEAVPYNNLFVP